MDSITIKKLFSENIVDTTVSVNGWIRSIRKNKNFSFMVINDGSCQGTLQVILDLDMPGYDEVSSLLAGSCVNVKGLSVKSQGKGQSLEVQAKEVIVYGKAGEDYPLQKKATSLEFLREQAHLRSRTNLFGAIFRVRHQLAMATHQFFSNRGFYYLNSPILTAVDAEGAGEMFNVTNMNLSDLPKNDKGEINYKEDYFGKPVHLCVTGQLEGECFAMGMGSVYTFGPTFRAENSNTHRHLSEFWMIEPEVAFMDLDGNAKLAEDYVRFMINFAFEYASDELEALQKYHQFSAKQNKTDYVNHLEVLKQVKDTAFEKITYTKAIEILEGCGEKFEFKPIWGEELQTEHERYLAEKHFKGPVIVTDYPKACKAFYMKQNDDGKTVRAMDVLVPGVGEIIGGSQREESYDKLLTRIKEMGMEEEPLWWYLELRKFGSAPHSGFGLGFERMIQYVTGMHNIRDVIAFPRTPMNCDF